MLHVKIFEMGSPPTVDQGELMHHESTRISWWYAWTDNFSHFFFGNESWCFDERYRFVSFTDGSRKFSHYYWTYAIETLTLSASFCIFASSESCLKKYLLTSSGYMSIVSQYKTENTRKPMFGVLANKDVASEAPNTHVRPMLDKLYGSYVLDRVLRKTYSKNLNDYNQANNIKDLLNPQCHFRKQGGHSVSQGKIPGHFLCFKTFFSVI